MTIVILYNGILLINKKNKLLDTKNNMDKYYEYFAVPA